MFVDEGAFIYNDLSEYTYEDLDDWDKPWSLFGPCGIQKMVVQLLG
jgi:hypothetical protein